MLSLQRPEPSPWMLNQIVCLPRIKPLFLFHGTGKLRSSSTTYTGGHQDNFNHYFYSLTQENFKTIQQRILEDTRTTSIIIFIPLHRKTSKQFNNVYWRTPGQLQSLVSKFTFSSPREPAARSRAKSSNLIDSLSQVRQFVICWSQNCGGGLLNLL